MDKYQAYYELYDTNNQKQEHKLSGKTILAIPKRGKDKEINDVAKMIIKEVKASSEDDSESLFGEDIFYSIPFGVKTEKELIEQMKVEPEKNQTNSEEQEDNKKEEKGGLGTGAIVGIVIGVVAAIAIICILVWFFVLRKKSDNNESSSASN
ncbi:hypothetical protein TVAG_226070 [Trichomonas vaginalis G3]|uniref:P270-related protein n=1 Tax=Trichomonas vaginalis (strain ATCC PRA-98 / G3) TaxID=412133 RepID=A2FSK6_TRIV3|nr:glycoprotein 38 family [Trichomonas vaginalis G3]EAX92107.1 hypothetical protein TVAG_226070 [Trichomonas vaginalis G3]KAI5548641.1 glycoprotein 38 family [Trichomonas vaginalis G3]|eukprot:XP_001305037.1 hypothetical protein [Trichomonas vaginalis G3]